MKDAELISRLQEVLIPDNWGGSHEDQLRHFHQGIAAIITALEANPPLAEVEGWMFKNELEEADDLTSWGYSHFRVGRERERDSDIPVTVTIRKSQ